MASPSHPALFIRVYGTTRTPETLLTGCVDTDGDGDGHPTKRQTHEPERASHPTAWASMSTRSRASLTHPHGS